MKFGNLFNMVEDSQEICAVFDNVETPEQMISTLERLKKHGAASFLELISSLRLSTEAVLTDTLEPNNPLGEGEGPDTFDDTGDDTGDDVDFEDLGKENSDSKSEILAEATATKK